MEKFAKSNGVHDVIIQGHYEHDTTDTRKLAEALVRPSDLDKVSRDFQEGRTLVRDVGHMESGQRELIIQAYNTGLHDYIYKDYPEIFNKPAKRLHHRVREGNLDQPVGHNFFVVMQDLINAKQTWADEFNQAIADRYGFGIQEVMHWDNSSKDRLLWEITGTDDKDLNINIATYLAHRSQAGEKFLQDEYGQVLDDLKEKAYDTTIKIGLTTGLDPAMVYRIKKQLQLTTFGSLDHLDGLVTTGNTGVKGDYESGTLRVEVHLDGTARDAKPKPASDVRETLSHEIHHSVSAQHKQENSRGAEWRVGLKAGTTTEGTDVNEGMTEYLSQVTLGMPNLVRNSNRHSQFDRTSYLPSVNAMYKLHSEFIRGENKHFAVLFNAYHGDAKDVYELEQALDAFYKYDIEYWRDNNEAINY